MEINSTSSAISSGQLRALNSYQQQASQAPKAEPKTIEPQSSAVVTLSARAQQLSRGEEVSKETETTTRVSGNQRSQTEQPTGIDFIKGDSKGGHINTFA